MLSERWDFVYGMKSVKDALLPQLCVLEHDQLNFSWHCIAVLQQFRQLCREYTFSTVQIFVVYTRATKYCHVARCQISEVAMHISEAWNELPTKNFRWEFLAHSRLWDVAPSCCKRIPFILPVSSSRGCILLDNNVKFLLIHIQKRRD